jgi:hypothetical protein
MNHSKEENGSNKTAIRLTGLKEYAGTASRENHFNYNLSTTSKKRTSQFTSHTQYLIHIQGCISSLGILMLKVISSSSTPSSARPLEAYKSLS